MDIIIIAIINISALIISWIAFRKSMESEESDESFYCKVDGSYVIMTKTSIEIANAEGDAIIFYTKDIKTGPELYITKRTKKEIKRYEKKVQEQSPTIVELYEQFVKDCALWKMYTGESNDEIKRERDLYKTL